MSRVWPQMDEGEILGLLSAYVLLVISFDAECRHDGGLAHYNYIRLAKLYCYNILHKFSFSQVSMVFG